MKQIFYDKSMNIYVFDKLWKNNLITLIFIQSYYYSWEEHWNFMTIKHNIDFFWKGRILILSQIDGFFILLEKNDHDAWKQRF